MLIRSFKVTGFSSGRSFGVVVGSGATGTAVVVAGLGDSGAPVGPAFGLGGGLQQSVLQDLLVLLVDFDNYFEIQELSKQHRNLFERLLWSGLLLSSELPTLREVL